MIRVAPSDLAPAAPAEKPKRVLTPDQAKAASVRARRSMARRQQSGHVALSVFVPETVRTDLQAVATATGETQAAVLARVLGAEVARLQSGTAALSFAEAVAGLSAAMPPSFGAETERRQFAGLLVEAAYLHDPQSLQALAHGVAERLGGPRRTSMRPPPGISSGARA